MIKGFDCLSACLTNAEIIKGNEVRDFEVYFSGGKITVELENGELWTNSHRRLSILLKPRRKRGIDYVLENADSVEDYVKKQVEQKHVLISEVDTSKLNYRNIFVRNDGVWHFVCVVDYSEADRTIYVIDGYISNEEETPFEGWIDVEQFLAASKECNYRHFIRDDECLASCGNEKMILQVVLDTINEYLNPPSGEKILGEDAIRKWIQDISEDDSIDKLLTQFKVYGFLTMKLYICEFLKAYPQYAALWSRYHDIIVEWGKLNRYLFFMKLRRRKDMLSTFKDGAMQLIKSEREVLEDVSRALGM